MNLDCDFPDIDLPANEEKRFHWVTRNKSAAVKSVLGQLYARLEGRCDTGIEASMCLGILVWFYGDGKGVPAGLMLEVCRPQYQLGWCKLDFLVTPNPDDPDRCFAIECDGEFWHENKAKDDRRDAFVASHGIPTYRFTGKEIRVDPTWCVMRAVAKYQSCKMRRLPQPEPVLEWWQKAPEEPWWPEGLREEPWWPAHLPDEPWWKE